MTTPNSSLDQAGGITAFAVELHTDDTWEVVRDGIHPTADAATAHLHELHEEHDTLPTTPTLDLRVTTITITRKETA